MPKSKKNKTKHNKKINNPVLFADFTELKAEKESSNDEIDKSTSGTECTESSGTENSDEWETVKGKGTIKMEKELANTTKEYRNIKKLYSYKDHKRDKESIDLVYERYELYKECNWDAEKIRKKLNITSLNVKISQPYYNIGDQLPADKSYQEFYVLFSEKGEVLSPDTRPGTPRFVISSIYGTPPRRDIYFSNHYEDFINIEQDCDLKLDSRRK